MTSPTPSPAAPGDRNRASEARSPRVFPETAEKLPAPAIEKSRKHYGFLEGKVWEAVRKVTTISERPLPKVAENATQKVLASEIS